MSAAATGGLVGVEHALRCKGYWQQVVQSVKGQHVI